MRQAVPFPACVASIVTLPTPVRVTTLPEMVASPDGAAYASGSPQSEVPMNTKGGSFAAPLAAGTAGLRNERIRGQRPAPDRRRPGCRTGAEGRSAGAGDRFFAALLAACRGAAEGLAGAAGYLTYREIAKQSETHDE